MPREYLALGRFCPQRNLLEQRGTRRLQLETRAVGWCARWARQTQRGSQFEGIGVRTTCIRSPSCTAKRGDAARVRVHQRSASIVDEFSTECERRPVCWRRTVQTNCGFLPLGDT